MASVNPPDGGIDDKAAAGRDAGASAIHDIAASARDVADSLEERQPDLARYARRAADSAEELSEAIRTRSVGDLLRDVDGFARREPVAFFGAALVAGFALTRFLGASGQGARSPAERRPDRDDVASRPSPFRPVRRRQFRPKLSRHMDAGAGLGRTPPATSAAPPPVSGTATAPSDLKH